MFIKCKAFFYALYLIFITNKLGQYCHHQYMNEYTESWEIQTIRLSPPESGGTRIQNQAGCFQTRNSAPFFVYSLTPSHFSSFSSFFPSFQNIDLRHAHCFKNCLLSLKWYYVLSRLIHIDTSIYMCVCISAYQIPAYYLTL